MARTRTRTQLLADVRMAGDLRAPRHPDADLQRWIDQGIAELYRILVEVNPDFFLESKDVTVVSGTATYALPTAGVAEKNFYKVVGVDVQEGSYWYNLPRFSFGARNRSQISNADKRTTSYRVIGSSLRLSPEPAWSGTVRVWYIPSPEELAAASTTFDGIAGLEEYVVLYAVIKGKQKDRYDDSTFKASMADMEKKIRSEQYERDFGEPDQIRDVCSNESLRELYGPRP